MVNTAFRLSGVSIIVGAVLMGAALILVAVSPAAGSSSLASSFVSVPLLLSSMLLLLALPAMYARQAEAAGWLGLAGHALLETGFLFLVSVASTPLRFQSGVAAGDNGVDFFLAVALGLGFLLTALATVRAGVYPHGAGLLLLCVTPAFFFDLFVSESLPSPIAHLGTAVLAVLLALGFAWIGLALAQGTGAQRRETSARPLSSTAR